MRHSMEGRVLYPHPSHRSHGKQIFVDEIFYYWNKRFTRVHGKFKRCNFDDHLHSLIIKQETHMIKLNQSPWLIWRMWLNDQKQREHLQFVACASLGYDLGLLWIWIFYKIFGITEDIIGNYFRTNLVVKNHI